MKALEVKLERTPIDRLDRHPDYPRLALPEDAVARLVAALGDGYPPHLAIRVRRAGDRYQIIGGVLRVEAALQAGLTHVLARVEDLDDAAALLELVADNAHAPLTDLELALHALTVARRARGGRSKKGGVSAFAKVLGKSEGHVRQLIKAAKVFRALTETPYSSTRFARRVKHLAAVHRAHPSVWPVLAPLIVDEKWTLKQTAEAVGKVVELFGPAFDPAAGAWWGVFLDPARVARALATSDATATKFKGLIARADATAAMFAGFRERGVDTAAEEARWRAWLKEKVGGESWRPMGLDEQLERMRNALAGRVARIDWRHGDWRAHIDKLADGSVRAVITDPPYGNGDGCLGDSGLPPLANNDTLEDAVNELRAFLLAIRPKLKADAHVVVFCDWNCFEAFKRVLAEVGLQVRTPAVWDKEMHGQGDPESLGGQCELILHATRGAATLYKRPGNVFHEQRVSGVGHPTAKPQRLLEKLIPVFTAAGDVIADGFGGSGTTALAARATGRACWATEVREEYFRLGQERLDAPRPPAAPGTDAPGEGALEPS